MLMFWWSLSLALFLNFSDIDLNFLIKESVSRYVHYFKIVWQHTFKFGFRHFQIPMDVVTAPSSGWYYSLVAKITAGDDNVQVFCSLSQRGWSAFLHIGGDWFHFG